MNSQITEAASLAELREHFASEEKAGFVRIGVSSVADKPEFDAIKKQFAVTARCLPFENEGQMMLVGRAY